MNKIKIGDICEILNGFAFRSEKYINSGVRIIRISNVQKGYIEDTNPVFYPKNECELDKYMLESGDLLMSLTGNVGRVAIVSDDFLPAALNQRVACLRMKSNKILKGFLFHILNSDFFEQKSILSSKGVAQKNMSTEWLKGYEIPLYSENKQKEIVAILDGIRACIVFRKKELDLLDNLIKARFVEMFGDPSINPKKYTVQPLSTIAKYWNGLTYKPEDVSKEGIIVLRSSNIQNDQLDFSDTVRVNCRIADNKFVKDNDILMCSRNGSAKLVGKVALIKNLPKAMSFGAFMMIIRSEYYPYLMTYFQMPAFRAQIITGATTTINQITGKMLDNVKLPIPDLSEIKEYLAFIQQIDKSKVVVQKALDEARLLFNSLMQKYFG